MTPGQFDELAAAALTFANTFDTEVGGPSGVISAASQMFKTGLVKSGTEAYDVLTRGMELLGPTNDDLLDTFKEYSTQFRDLGLDGETALGLINQAVQAGGRDTDVAAGNTLEGVQHQSGRTAPPFDIRRVHRAGSSTVPCSPRSLPRASPGAASAMGLVLAKLGAIKDPLQKAQIAAGLFGTQSEDYRGRLNAMDPTTAVASLAPLRYDETGRRGGVGTPHGVASESGSRGMETNVTEFVDAQAVPSLDQLSAKMHRAFGQDIGESLRAGADQNSTTPKSPFYAGDVAEPILNSMFGIVGAAKGVWDQVREDRLGRPRHRDRRSVPGRLRWGSPGRSKRRSTRCWAYGTGCRSRRSRPGHDRSVRASRSNIGPRSARSICRTSPRFTRVACFPVPARFRR